MPCCKPAQWVQIISFRKKYENIWIKLIWIFRGRNNKYFAVVPHSYRYLEDRCTKEVNCQVPSLDNGLKSFLARVRSSCASSKSASNFTWPIFFIFQNIIFQIFLINPVKLYFQKNSQFPNLISQISNFHKNINLEKTMP